MNEIKKNKTQKTTKKAKLAWLNGLSISNERVIKNMPFLLFLVFLALVYIANGYMAEATIRKHNQASKQLKELRSEYITTKSDLMYISKQSEIAMQIAQRGLEIEESLIPPSKIVVDTVTVKYWKKD